MFSREPEGLEDFLVLNALEVKLLAEKEKKFTS